MKYRQFSYTSTKDFIEDIGRLEKGIPYSDDISVLKESLAVGSKLIENRLLAQPIEGFDSYDNGVPSKRVFDRYKELVRGGSGTIWMESISVNYEGRSSSKQMWINNENIDDYKVLIDEIRKNGTVYIVAQLTHSGRNSNPNGKGLAVCAFENPIIPRQNFRIISDAELGALRDDYVSAAVLAEKAGFDAIDIRACHGYLINELFSAYNRSGKYGGSYENRTRLIKDIIRDVRQKVNITICVRLNIMDGLPYPYGWGCDVNDARKQNLTEPLRLVNELVALGVDVINVTAGVGAYSPHMIRPFDRGDYIPDEHPLEGIERLLQSARQVKKAVPSICVVASGFSWLRNFAPMVAAGGIKEGWFDIAGFGRQWVAYPAYANDILAGREIQKFCKTCSGCSALIKSGRQMRCIRA